MIWPLYFCRLCLQPVRKNYDHVGDCEGAMGKCSGTFEHSSAAVNHYCPKRDLTHREVSTSR